MSSDPTGNCYRRILQRPEIRPLNENSRRGYTGEIQFINDWRRIIDQILMQSALDVEPQ
jgi:hypothetical protein